LHLNTLMKILLLIAIVISFSFSVPPYIIEMRKLDLIEAQLDLEKSRHKIISDFMEHEDKITLKRKNTL